MVVGIAVMALALLGALVLGTKVLFAMGAFALFLAMMRPVGARADVRIPHVFGDNMALQRDMPVPVWGTADPGEFVSVEFAGQSVATATDADGNWRVTLEPSPAGGPYDLTVRGKTIRTFKNILVGDVWVCSGQSNMQWPVEWSLNAVEEIANATYPRIRLFTVPPTVAQEPKLDVGGGWVACAPETVPNFSAVAYFFGRALHRELGVPVGLINTSWGGTAVEAWTSRSALAASPDFAPILARVHADDDPNKPSVLFNGMIRPLLPFGIRGAIWYQGESNVGRAYHYRSLFPTMIRDWRSGWSQGDFPFLFVQLANFGEPQTTPGDSDWAELREAQTMALSVPNTAMASAIDIGDALDIHPKNKQDVGERLALCALGTVFGWDVEYSGPLYSWMTVEGNAIRLRFDHVGNGLAAKGSDTLEGFAVAGADRRWMWADARIERDTVVVSTDAVPHPVAVRYGWHHNPVGNLYNRAGLPASPFRTDEWEGVTANNR
jgi:sialate O-acetylesterase